MIKIFQGCGNPLALSFLRARLDKVSPDTIQYGDNKLLDHYIEAAVYVHEGVNPDGGSILGGRRRRILTKLTRQVEKAIGVEEAFRRDLCRIIHTTCQSLTFVSVIAGRDRQEWVKAFVNLEGYPVLDRPLPLSCVEMANGVLAGQVKVYHGLVDALIECGQQTLSDHFSSLDHSESCWAAHLIAGWDGEKVSDAACYGIDRAIQRMLGCESIGELEFISSVIETPAEVADLPS